MKCHTVIINSLSSVEILVSVCARQLVQYCPGSEGETHTISIMSNCGEQLRPSLVPRPPPFFAVWFALSITHVWSNVKLLLHFCVLHWTVTKQQNGERGYSETMKEIWRSSWDSNIRRILSTPVCLVVQMGSGQGGWLLGLNFNSQCPSSARTGVVEHDAEISLVVTIQQVTMYLLYVLTMVCILEERRSSSESESLSESKISITCPGENITWQREGDTLEVIYTVSVCMGN